MASRILSLLNCAGGNGGAKQRKKKSQQEKQARKFSAKYDERHESPEEACASTEQEEVDSGLQRYDLGAESMETGQLNWRTFNYLGKNDVSKDKPGTASYSLTQVHFADSRPLRVRSYHRGNDTWAAPPEPAVWCVSVRQDRLETRLVSLRPNSRGLQPGSCQPALVYHTPDWGGWDGVYDSVHDDKGTRRFNVESDSGQVLMQLDGRLLQAMPARPRQPPVLLMDDCATFCCSQGSLFAQHSRDGTLSYAPLRRLCLPEESTPAWRRRWRLFPEDSDAASPATNSSYGWHTLAYWPAGRRLFAASRTFVLALCLSGLDQEGDRSAGDRSGPDSQESEDDDYDVVDSDNVKVEDAICVFRLPLVGAGYGPDKFNRVTDLAVDPRGILLVCDQCSGRVHAYNAGTGRYIATIGGYEFPPDVVLMDHLLPSEGLCTYKQPGLLQCPTTLCVFQPRGGDRMLLVSGGLGCVGQTFDISRLHCVQ